jgi:transposase
LKEGFLPVKRCCPFKNKQRNRKETNMTKALMAGIDLHSNNVMIGIVDQQGRRVAHQKLPCELARVVGFLKPYRARLKSVAVESTYNWYWLVDGLRAQGYPVVLANPAGFEPYSGIKHVDDKSDAFFLAELQRLNILPTGYIYDPQLRPVRDLLRRRLGLVQQRTALLVSFKSLYVRTTGQELKLGRLKALAPEEAGALYEHPANQLIARLQKEHIQQLDRSIGRIEKTVLGSVRQSPCYQRLNTLPGVGRILGMTITLEVGEIGRFKAAGNFASYCRAVDARRTSNEKNKGRNNRKCGNKYLGWAFVEAANFARRYDERSRKWFDRKAAKTSRVLATRALACKLAKAAWHVMTQNVDYDGDRVYGRAVGSPGKGLAPALGN